MFGVLAVIPEFSSPDVRDFTDSDTFFFDIQSQNHQNHRHFPDHHKTVTSRIITGCLNKKKTGCLERRNLSNFSRNQA
jgi:hypothetical protein